MDLLFDSRTSNENQAFRIDVWSIIINIMMMSHLENKMCRLEIKVKVDGMKMVIGMTWMKTYVCYAKI